MQHTFYVVKRSLKLVSLTLMLSLVFIGCQKDEEPTYQTKAEAETFVNLAYGNDGMQVMDVYLPQNRTSNTATLILIHGGSFIGGDKSQYTVMAKFLASKGFAVLNVNYRLVDAEGVYNRPMPIRKESAVKIKDQVTDINAVVDFAISHAKQWVVSKERLAITGHSAGGTLGLLYSYSDNNNNKVKAISNLAGALDLVFTNLPGWQDYPPYIFEGAYRFTGAEVSIANESVYKAISPLYAANTTKKVPALNIFPQDNNVDGLPLQDRATYDKFTARLDELKVPNEFFYVAGADHAFSKPGNMSVVLEKTINYFKEKLY